MKYMELALEEAKKAYLLDEIPVGCVIVQNGKVVAKAHNTAEKQKNAICHAEINAINEAVKNLGSKNLSDCEMYVTLEPCPMCAGAIINTRIKRLYIGAMEKKSGCFGSIIDFGTLGFNHTAETYIGICEDECKKLMTDFFKKKR